MIKCFGGFLHCKMASFKILVLSILEAKISVLFFSVYLQSTDFPAKFMTTSVFSNSFSQPEKDLAFQFTYLIWFLISDFPRVKITISSNLFLK